MCRRRARSSWLWPIAVASIAIACGDDDGGGGPVDAASIADAAAIPDAPGSAPDAVTAPDAAPTGPDAAAGCTGETLPTADISGTEGIAIAADGTLYYSQARGVGRRQPGGDPDDAWVALPDAATVWGVVARDDGMVFVGSPSSGGAIYRIDSAAAMPMAEVLYPDAGGANGLAIGPDGAIYYSDFSGGRVYRVSDAGERTEVTASPLASANGLLFEDDGSLLVLSYSAGAIWRLAVDADMRETGRESVATLAGTRLDGIGRDALGRYYVTNNQGGELIRLDATFGDPQTLVDGVGAAANVAFGKGALTCTDVYVASSGTLARFAGDAAGVP